MVGDGERRAGAEDGFDDEVLEHGVIGIDDDGPLDCSIDNPGSILADAGF